MLPVGLKLALPRGIEGLLANNWFFKKDQLYSHFGAAVTLRENKELANLIEAKL